MPPPPQQHSRISLVDLKSQIVKKLGPDRANRYFYFLCRFLGRKISKSEFDKLCCSTLGRENLPLHNQLIRSVLSNAANGVVPPPLLLRKETAIVSGKKENAERLNGTVSASIWSNGDVPVSPRKARSAVRDRRIKDRPSPLGPNGKTSHQLSSVEELVGRSCFENGLPTPCDLDRPLHHHGFAERPVVQPDSSLFQPTNRVHARQSSSQIEVSVQNQMCATMNGVREEIEQDTNSDLVGNRSTIRVPLGLPFCPASIGGAHRALPGPNSSSFANSVDSCELSDTETLRKRMEQVAGSEGLNGVSLDCANLLNNGLDAYLKRLIKSCIDLVRARSEHETVKHVIYREKPQEKIINGAWLNHHGHIQRNIGTVEVVKDGRGLCPISLSDFKVAMELNPQQLGEDWPLLLEKICFNCYEK